VPRLMMVGSGTSCADDLVLLDLLATDVPFSWEACREAWLWRSFSSLPVVVEAAVTVSTDCRGVAGGCGCRRGARPAVEGFRVCEAGLVPRVMSALAESAHDHSRVPSLAPGELPDECCDVVRCTGGCELTRGNVTESGVPSTVEVVCGVRCVVVVGRAESRRLKVGVAHSVPSFTALEPAFSLLLPPLT
jgi:hypothetical protein